MARPRSIISARLLPWYDRHARRLPWRALPGQTPNPYHVWLSEIMLQQTTVAAVIAYFQDFTHRWPTVQDLAAAELEEVLHAWQGLGYYARARNLHKCARQVVDVYDGQFPPDEKALQALPGIGPYTSAAIAAIAFNQPAAPVDGNIERILTRLFTITTPLPQAKPEIKARMVELVPHNRPGDFAQALMDLGATICAPKNPKCSLCPLQAECQAHQQNRMEEFPVKAAKVDKPNRYGLVFWVEDAQGRLWLRRRPPRGLLGGMTEFPSTQWWQGEKPTNFPLKSEITSPTLPDYFQLSAPDFFMRPEDVKHLARLQWQPTTGTVRHTFTHFHLHLQILRAQVATPFSQEDLWQAPENLHELALPSLMKKVARHGLGKVGS